MKYTPKQNQCCGNCRSWFPHDIDSIPEEDRTRYPGWCGNSYCASFEQLKLAGHGHKCKSWQKNPTPPTIPT